MQQPSLGYFIDHEYIKMPTLPSKTHDALYYTGIGMGAAASVAAFSIWWFSKFWKILIVSILAGVVALSVLTALLLALYVKKEEPKAPAVMKRLPNSASQRAVPGFPYRIKVLEGAPMYLCLTQVSEKVYHLSTTPDLTSAAQFVFEPMGQVNELTIRPAIYYHLYTIVNGEKYYATPVKVDKPMASYTAEEVNDPFLYFRPRLTSLDAGVRDAQFRCWPYHVLEEFKWETNRAYEVSETDEIYLSFRKAIAMNHGCTLYRGSIDYSHVQFSLLMLIS